MFGHADVLSAFDFGHKLRVDLEDQGERSRLGGGGEVPDMGVSTEAMRDRRSCDSQMLACYNYKIVSHKRQGMGEAGSDSKVVKIYPQLN
jgi:hypothetical protein